MCEDAYFQREAKDLHLPPGSCLKEREIEKANKLVKTTVSSFSTATAKQLEGLPISTLHGSSSVTTAFQMCWKTCYPLTTLARINSYSIPLNACLYIMTRCGRVTNCACVQFTKINLANMLDCAFSPNFLFANNSRYTVCVCVYVCMCVCTYVDSSIIDITVIQVMSILLIVDVNCVNLTWQSRFLYLTRQRHTPITTTETDNPMTISMSTLAAPPTP